VAPALQANSSSRAAVSGPRLSFVRLALEGVDLASEEIRREAVIFGQEHNSTATGDVPYASLSARCLAASDNMIRVTPVIIMLMPTKVPITHTELDGQCM
jgi:hypothetical protein